MPKPSPHATQEPGAYTVCTCPGWGGWMTEHQPGCAHYRGTMRVLVNGTPIELLGIEQALARIEGLLKQLVERA